MECPRCGKEVDLHPWVDYDCPHCGKEGSWEEDFFEDEDGFTDSVVFFYWEL